MKRPRSLCALVIASAVLAAACGSDDDESDPTTADTTTESTAPEPSTPDTSTPDSTTPDSTDPDGAVDPSDGSEPQALRSDVERVRPGADAPVRDVAVGSNDAGFALQQQLGVGDENVVFSPASLAIAFAMADAGADDATAAQLSKVFGFPQGDATHEAMNALLQGLVPNNANDPEEGAETSMSVANSGWTQAGQDVGSDFLDTLASQYGSGLFATDFAGDTEGSRQAINAWVEKETKGLIPELIGKGQLSPETVYTLINALYFMGAWTDTFDESATEPKPFTKPDGSQVDVPMMFDGDRDASYIADGDLTAITMPYGDGEFEMKIVMPRQLGQFIGTLDAERWSQLDLSFREGKVNLTVPTWETETALDLAAPLTAMGLEVPGGSYPGITPQATVGSVLQAAKITVDETGTEAAAATAIMDVTAAPLDEENKPVDITFDRPFFYTIEHAPTGLVLFAGQVVDPAA